MIDGADLEVFARSVRAAVERHSGASLDAALAELGWADALAEDAGAAVSTLFAAQGEANATSSALARVIGSDVLPALGSSSPPGEVVSSGVVRVRGLAVAGDAATLTVVVHGDGGDLAVRVRTADLSWRRVGGVDPDLGVGEVDGECAAEGATPVDWPAAITLGRLAVAHELVGASRAMLGLAREHAVTRVQFDRPIAGFQAVRHRLAETLVAVETAEAALDAAWIDRSAASAAMAKAVAGRAARTASRHCQQVLAGIGFTTEHPLHRYVRRVLVLDELLGSARALTAELGRALLASRSLPPLLPL